MNTRIAALLILGSFFQLSISVHAGNHSYEKFESANQEGRNQNGKKVNTNSPTIDDPEAGTYQFLMKGRGYPSIPGNLNEILKKNRHQTQTTYIKLGTAVTLKILSKEEISRPNFKAVEKIVYNSTEQ